MLKVFNCCVRALKFETLYVLIWIKKIYVTSIHLNVKKLIVELFAFFCKQNKSVKQKSVDPTR